MHSLFDRGNANRDSWLWAAVERSELVVVAVDRQLVIQVWSGGAERLFGWRAPEAEGKRLDELGALADPVRRRQADRWMIDVLGGKRWSGDWTGRCKDGAHVSLRTTAEPLRDEHDEIVGVITFTLDVTGREVFERALVRQAMHDPLTGLPNRTLVRDRLAHAVVRARGAGDGVTAVVFVDLDDFKQVNDILGHAAGDAVLVEVAGRLRALVRSEDLVGRLAGDEFVVVCRLADRDRDVRALAERIGAALAVPVVAGDREVTVSASVGVAFLDPDVGADVLLERADAAMYRSKDAGKATYRLAAPDGTIILP